MNVYNAPAAEREESANIKEGLMLKRERRKLSKPFVGSAVGGFLGPWGARHATTSRLKSAKRVIFFLV